MLSVYYSSKDTFQPPFLLSPIVVRIDLFSFALRFTSSFGVCSIPEIFNAKLFRMFLRFSSHSLPLRIVRDVKIANRLVFYRCSYVSQPDVYGFICLFLAAEDDANDGGDNDTPAAPPAFGMALRQRQRQRPDDHDRRNGTKLALDAGDDELDAYVVDGKRYGNIARYYNHSCTPNMFVQSVFVDTHDPRLPWIAFFAAQHIVAGTELTWDYNYVPRSVPGKRLECLCGTRNCRKRLL